MRLTINDVRHEEDFTLYSIVIESGHCKWRVWKRYSELCDLHERVGLCSCCGSLSLLATAHLTAA